MSVTIQLIPNECIPLEKSRHSDRSVQSYGLSRNSANAQSRDQNWNSLSFLQVLLQPTVSKISPDLYIYAAVGWVLNQGISAQLSQQSSKSHTRWSATRFLQGLGALPFLFPEDTVHTPWSSTTLSTVHKMSFGFWSYSNWPDKNSTAAKNIWGREWIELFTTSLN